MLKKIVWHNYWLVINFKPKLKLMKTLNQLPFFILVLFVLAPFSSAKAQVSIGGQIDINIGLPDIVVVKPAPKKKRAPRRKRPVVIRDRGPVYERVEYSYGTIRNQNNGPKFDYQVVEASIVSFSKSELDLILHFDTGDIMAISMHEANFNDYNFHYYNSPNDCNNTIESITINDTPIALNNAAVSLQPKDDSYTAVVNLHSLYDGDFNGTVKHIN